MTESPIQQYRTRSGPMLALATDLYVGRSLALYGEYNPEEGRILRQIVKPGMTVVEIGANMGSHSVDLARACAPGFFHAFEPQQRLFQLLCANLALNRIDNAFVYPDACGAAEGQAELPFIDYAVEGNFGGVALGRQGMESYFVRVRAIDGLGLAACGLIKIDVEGHEADVLRGARETIMRCRPVLYVENDRIDRQGELIELIAGMDYRMWWHLPPLFDPNNFAGVTDNVFGTVVSANMLCLPRESGGGVGNAPEIDPENWESPQRRR